MNTSINNYSVLWLNKYTLEPSSVNGYHCLHNSSTLHLTVNKPCINYFSCSLRFIFTNIKLCVIGKLAKIKLASLLNRILPNLPEHIAPAASGMTMETMKEASCWTSGTIRSWWPFWNNKVTTVWICKACKMVLEVKFGGGYSQFISLFIQM